MAPGLAFEGKGPTSPARLIKTNESEHYYETAGTSQREMTQIHTLIANICRSVELLNCDIDFEEERARVHDLPDPAYPVLARQLRLRRENLNATVAACEPGRPSHSVRTLSE
jgi:hypothetical protein